MSCDTCARNRFDLYIPYGSYSIITFTYDDGVQRALCGKKLIVLWQVPVPQWGFTNLSFLKAVIEFLDVYVLVFVICHDHVIDYSKELKHVQCTPLWYTLSSIVLGGCVGPATATRCHIKCGSVLHSMYQKRRLHQPTSVEQKLQQKFDWLTGTQRVYSNTHISVTFVATCMYSLRTGQLFYIHVHFSSTL